MAQRSHVPKFGNWDGQNIPYTACFDNARKGRGAGGRILNPNDPEDMRELIREEHRHEPPSDVRRPLVVQAPSSAEASDKINVYTAQQIHQEKKHRNKEGGASASHMKSPYHDHAYYRDAQKSRKDKSNIAGSGGDEGYAGRPSANSHRSSARSNDLGGRSYNSPHSPTPRQAAPGTNKNSQPVEAQHRVASVPKFGAWNVASPQAEGGFTVIFDKVKEERHKSANYNQPSVMSTPAYSPPREIRDNKPTRSKMLCCLWPTGS